MHVKWDAGLLLTSGEYLLIWSTSQNTFSVHISLFVRENDRWLFSVLSLWQTLLPNHCHSLIKNQTCTEKTHCLLPVVSWLPIVIYSVMWTVLYYIAMSVNVTSVVLWSTYLRPAIHSVQLSRSHVDWYSVDEVYLYSDATTSKIARTVTQKLGFSKGEWTECTHSN